MLFNIEVDLPHQISGYFVPDSYSGASVVRVVHGRGDPLIIEAAGVIPELVSIGRHATGKCRFWFDQSVIPCLPEIQDLEIQEPETGLRLYRRRPAEGIVRAKVFRLETHLAPLWHLDDALDYKFQFLYKSIEQFGRETTTQILELVNADSRYASGRILLKPYEYLLYNGFQLVCLFRDPYAELAERLLLLKQVNEGDPNLLGVRESMMFDEAIEFVATLDLSDERQLRRAFGKISNEDAAIFADPLVRSLVARTPSEMVDDTSIGSALEALSGFAVVGLREHPELFIESLGAVLGISPTDLPPVSESVAVVELGRVLREIGTVRHLIEHDVELYNCVKAALEQTL